MLDQNRSGARTEFLTHGFGDGGQITTKELQPQDVSDDLLATTLELYHSYLLLLNNLDLLFLFLRLFSTFLTFSRLLRVNFLKKVGMVIFEPIFAVVLVNLLPTVLAILRWQGAHSTVDNGERVGDCGHLLLGSLFLAFFKGWWLVIFVFLLLSAAFALRLLVLVLLFLLAEDRIVV